MNFELKSPKSGNSHYTFRKSGCTPITILKYEPDNIEKYSGQFKLRIPKSLHRLLAEHFQKEGNSIIPLRINNNPELVRIVISGQ